MKPSTLVIVIIVLLLIGALAYRLSSAQTPTSKLDLYGDVPLDAQLLPIDRKALDEAYHAHLIKLWNVWLTDGAKEAGRFRNGLMISRGAYAQALEALSKREQKLKEQPK